MNKLLDLVADSSTSNSDEQHQELKTLEVVENEQCLIKMSYLLFSAMVIEFLIPRL